MSIYEDIKALVDEAAAEDLDQQAAIADLEEAVATARRAAGDRTVLVHGARLARKMLQAGLLDEIHLHVVPVLLGSGRRLFDKLKLENVELATVSAEAGTDVTHLRYRVAGSGS